MASEWGRRPHHRGPCTRCELVRRNFRSVNTRKTVGPDGISVRVHRACTDQLVSIFMVIFNLSLTQSVISICFKVVLVPKKPHPNCLNDHWQVTLTFMVMNSVFPSGLCETVVGGPWTGVPGGILPQKNVLYILKLNTSLWCTLRAKLRGQMYEEL